MKRLLYFPFLVLALAIFLIASAFTLPDFTKLPEVLGWIVSGVGASVIVLALGAWLQAKWPWWAQLDGLLKNIISGVAASLLAVGALLLLQQAALIELLQPWYGVIAAVIISLLSGGLYLIGRKRGVLVENKRLMDS